MFVNTFDNTAMPKVSFSTHSKTGHFVLTYSCYDGRLFYYTGQRGSDKGTQSKLNRMKAAVEELEVDYKIKGHPLTKAIVRATLDKLNHKSPRINSMLDKMSQVVDKMEYGEILTPKKKKYSKLSIKTLRFTVSFLDKFKMPEVVTMDTYYQFIKYCHEKEYSTNYIGGQIKNWKTLFGHIGIELPKEFKKITELTYDIYLDESEIKKIYELKIDLKKKGIARDWFVLDCYTGLRVSDLVLLNKKNYHNGLITIANEKTDEKVVIPVHPYVKEILKKYNGFPPKLWDVEINEEIKKVAKEAGITSRVLFTITKGGKRKDEYLYKWQMVSNHTARRSFITNLRKNGVHDSIIMKLTGIKSLQTLQRYDKLSADEAAKIAAGLDFFK